jgi:hypothetical protein
VDCGGGKSCPAGNVCVKGGAECLTREQLAKRAEDEKKQKVDEARRAKEAREAEEFIKKEKIRVAQEEARKKVEAQREAARQKEELRRQEVQRQKDAEEKRIAEKRRQEEEARQLAKRKQEEETARKLAEIEAKQKAAAEARQKADDAKRLAAEAEAKRKGDERIAAAARAANEKAEREKVTAERVTKEQAEMVQKSLLQSNSTLSKNGLNLSVSGTTVSAILPPPETPLAKAARERRDAAIQRVADAVGVKDIRDPKEIAKLGLGRFVKAIQPDIYKGVKDIEGVAKDSIALAKSRRDGTFDSESQRVLNDNGLKLAAIIVKEKKLDGVINVGKLKDTADLAAASNTYLQETIRKYEANNAKAVAYQDVATSADRVTAALQRKRTATTPDEKQSAEAFYEKAKLDLLVKKRTADLVDTQEKEIKPDIKPLVTMAGKLTDKALQPLLDPLSKTALAISKEAARDLPTMWVKIQATEAVTKADTQLAQSIQTALDAKKIRDTAKSPTERSAASEKYSAAMKEVGIRQQEAEARRATNYLIRALPEDSVIGTVADIIAPEKMIQFDRNQK